MDPTPDAHSAIQQRKIIHCDMDAFFASVEQHDNPRLRGKPVVVGGDPKSRAVVAAASYEARKYGIKSAISCAKAYRLCPETIFVKPNFSRYCEVSEQIRSIFESVTSLVEPLSLDEAYLDVTENKLGEPIAQKIALYLKDQIFKVTGLTASAGVASNKFIAKIASDLQKPNGLTVIPPHRVDEFLKTLPVEKMWGVGPVTAKSLHALGLRTAGDIRRISVQIMEKEFGTYGPFLHGLANGIDTRPVETGGEPKSRGTETTFERDVLDTEILFKTIRTQALEVSEILEELQFLARTVTLKIKYSDFKSITRSKTLINPTDNIEYISRTACDLLLQSTEAGNRPIRLIGITVSNFVGPDEPLQLWFDFPLV